MQSARPEAATRAPLVAWTERLVLFVVGLVFIHWVSGGPPVHPDTDRDLLLARECTQFDVCVTAGATASFAGLLHGALWIHALSAARLLGLGLAQFRIVLFAAQALSAVLVYETARRFTPARLPILAWAAYLPLSALTVEVPLLWNPSIVPLPLALFHCATLIAVRRRRTEAFVIAAIALALADSHIITSALFPWLIVVGIACAQRPWRVSLVVLPTFLLASALVSFQTTVTHLMRLAPSLLVVAVCVALLVAVGWAIRTRVQSASSLRRTAMLLGSLIVYLGGGLSIAALVTGHPISPRYGAAVIPAVSIGAPWALDIVVELVTSHRVRAREAIRWAVHGALAIGLATLVAPPRAERGWTLEDVQTVGAILYRSGETFESLARRIRGPDAYSLVRALGSFEPDRSDVPPPEMAMHPDLLVVRVRASDVPHDHPSSWTVVALRDGYSWVARPRSSRLDTDHIEICLRRLDDETEHDRDHECAVTSMASWTDPERAGRSWGRFIPTLGGVRDVFGEPGLLPPADYAWSTSFPIRHEDAPVSEHLATADHGPASFSMRIASSGGDENDVRFDTEIGAQVEHVAFVRALDRQTSGQFHGWIPDYAEMGDDEPALRELVRRSIEQLP